jgi:uncharacterized protein (TIGR03086 family)
MPLSSEWSVVDLHGALDIATAGFARTLRLVEPTQWSAPTPNPGWSVRDLVNHVVGGNRRYVLLLAGAPTEQVEALRDQHHLSDEPDVDFAATSLEVVLAFKAPGVLGRTVHHRLGDRSGRDLLVMRIMEHALHGWDLARAIEADDELDPPVVHCLLEALDADPTLLTRTGFTPVEPPADASPAEILLALTGRR